MFKASAIVASLVALSAVQTAAAAPTCAELLRAFPPLSAEVSRLVSPDAYQQWLLWEQLANLSKFHKPTHTIEVPLVARPAETLKVVKSATVPSALIRTFFPGEGLAYWPKHPYNQHPAVPFHDSPAIASLPVHLTSSRSMELSTVRGFTMKVATDHPHGPEGERQASKIKINDDIDSAMIHSAHLEAVEREMGVDPKLIMLGEAMTIEDKKSGFGVVIRDVRKLDGGHYYLPAFSIPYIGHEIAALNGKSFEEFFGENYAALLGEAKARLLLRTSLQMLTPNPQNVLIQLDRNLRPTGRIVLRDISDAYMVDVVAKGLGYENQVRANMKAGYKPVSEIKPFWSNSSWRFNASSFLARKFPWLFKEKASEHSISLKTVEAWGKIHNQRFVEYIERELGIKIDFDPNASPENKLRSVYKALKSESGQQKLFQYRERKKAARSAQAATIRKATYMHLNFIVTV